ncbi:MAG: NAD(P)H-hydrate dehydratase [Micavibrio aeruginosavorus]|uniref:ADP-dependent (S)-NAD(P)H-hydrate dehydratase n=1 Tax=Micavibrio aeruginosavorus TaxID=349221 RepID=A0A2W5FHI9_9BACT|nr:MAG: NAD(P)H-hydrate dehydratase [Micavibrio aeruginosavorus]
MDWKKLIKAKSMDKHKYDYGHVVVYGGSQMTGAAGLAAISALRMGAGLVTIAVPRETTYLYRQLSTSLIVEEMTDFKDHFQDKRRNMLLIGPGAGHETERPTLDVIESGKLCVLDADALKLFILGKTHDKCILTPHEGEFERLFPDTSGGKADRALKAAKFCRAIIVLKGHETIIASPDGRFEIISNGSPWLATAGSGDVLAGMIAGFAAWHKHEDMLFESVCAAVWMHGEASQLAGPGMISADLPDQIKKVWQNLLNH